MKRVFNIITCLQHFKKVSNMLMINESGKLTVSFTEKLTSVKYARQAQTSFIMNDRFFYTKMNKLAATLAILIISMTAVFSQDTLKIKGVILNSANQPVMNVSVGVEGSFDLPAVTNEAGEFSVKSLSGNGWLNVAPSSDYKKKRANINDRTKLKIYLTELGLASQSMVKI